MFSGKGETPDKALGRVSNIDYGKQKMGYMHAGLEA